MMFLIFCVKLKQHKGLKLPETLFFLWKGGILFCIFRVETFTIIRELKLMMNDDDDDDDDDDDEWGYLVLYFSS